MTTRHRVLVVDDSAFARKVMREVLSAAPDLEVVGFARDGLDALEKIEALAPDVVTLDLMMPGLDGPGVLRALPPARAPRVVVVSTADVESELVVEALALGAFDFVHKPTSLATDRLYELGGELVRKVRAAAESRPATGPSAVAVRRAPAERTPHPPVSGDVRLVVIGTSTGGPAALNAVLPALPAALPVPVLVALHIPAEYTAAMAERLDQESPLRVIEASDGLVLGPGTVVLARGGLDLTVADTAAGLVARTGFDRSRNYHPSVDALFESAARACGAGVLGVVLTGMGDDGLVGARAIRAAGGHLVVESEETAVVYGMPRAVWDGGLADARVPVDRVA
ncbi:MAG TPA: chemotaxis-specific protein-glutamate methyltransferase CheB, partial [Anaeromyxobacteraceae bacterium]|nr:chemotaxis-specific protein-glutamate methyltransferase CheB [Anaeromyxobacteraceae bacterium]